MKAFGEVCLSRRLTAIVYFLAGMSLLSQYISIASAFPFFLAASGGSAAEHPFLAFLCAGGLLSLGCALLALSGVATLLGPGAQPVWLVVGAAMILVLFAIWVVPQAGGEAPAGIFLWPFAAALVAGIPLVWLLKRAWIAALVGTLLASPLVIRAASILRAYFVLRDSMSGPIFGRNFFNALDGLAGFVAAPLWLAALVCAIVLRLQ